MTSRNLRCAKMLYVIEASSAEPMLAIASPSLQTSAETAPASTVMNQLIPIPWRLCGFIAADGNASRPWILAYSDAVRRGRILAIKWGMNPNSSSLGVDVTFLLVGATALAAVTPVIGAILRWRRPVRIQPDATAGK
jgi:hypothetical protein